MNYKKILFYKINGKIFTAILMFLLGIAVVKVDKLAFSGLKLQIVLVTLLVGAALIASDNYKIRWVSLLVNIICAGVIVLLIMLLTAGIFRIIPGPYTDIELYPIIFDNGEDYISEIKHFPRKIPENAKEVEMRYWRGLMQGRGYFWLKYKTDTNEIEELKKMYPFENLITERFDRTLHNLDYFDDNEIQKKTFDKENHPFYSYDITYHSGIAFNSSTQEVFYWFYVE